MPSQTVHIPEKEYREALERKGDEQSTSGRFAELIEKGLLFEAENDN